MTNRQIDIYLERETNLRDRKTTHRLERDIQTNTEIN